MVYTKDFGPRDERVSHFRRYEKEPLRRLLTSAGFEVIETLCYGFPFPKLIQRATEVFVDKPILKIRKTKNTQERTSISGTERSLEYKYRNL